MDFQQGEHNELAMLPPPPPLPPPQASGVLMPIAPARPGGDLGAPLRSPPCCSQLCTLWHGTHTQPFQAPPTASKELCAPLKGSGTIKLVSNDQWSGEEVTVL
jgi:hypothetical protein